MKSGLILGVSFSLLNLFQSLTSSIFLGTILSVASFFALFYCIFHYTSQYKDEVLMGKISYGQAFKFSLYMFFFGGMIYAVFNYLFYSFFPEQLEEQLSILQEASKTIFKDSSNYDDAMKLIQSYSLKDLTLSSFSGFVFFGFFISLITSLRFCSTKKD